MTYVRASITLSSAPIVRWRGVGGQAGREPFYTISTRTQSLPYFTLDSLMEVTTIDRPRAEGCWIVYVNYARAKV